MKIFLDTAEIEETRTAARWGVLDGVTTNPSLCAKVGGSYDEILQAVCKITPGVPAHAMLLLIPFCDARASR